MVSLLGFWVPTTAVALLSLLGGAILASGLRNYWVQYRAVSHAEQAIGTIETVDIQPVFGSRGSTYVPTIEYEYQTPTQRLRGGTIYPGQSQVTKVFHSESAARAPIEGYEPGTETTVYYDPSSPNESFLIPKTHTGPEVAKIVFGSGLLGLGVIVLYQTGLISQLVNFI